MLNSTTASSSAGRLEPSWRLRGKYPNRGRYAGVALSPDDSVSFCSMTLSWGEEALVALNPVFPLCFSSKAARQSPEQTSGFEARLEL